ncbi:hypothetical protein BJF90_08650 [Pseudonocardia sp. CNS-004]|nr:hypothetical protein BJF90_08650 [Pseudonocardia sp. CNS-004]
MRQLRHDGVEVRTKATVVAIEPGAVVHTDPDGGSHAVLADIVALAIGWRPTGASFETPRGVEVWVLGDAEQPADFVRAVNSAADAALAL